MDLEKLLQTVQKPARYTGGEWNSVRKEWTPDRVKFLVAFPDLYEIGMSYLGMKIIYGILNERDDCLAERAFAPWLDFEEALRANSMELFSLESRRGMKEFDIVGFSLAYELSYTNVLNMLDLGGIPVRSADRSDADPLIIAGGSSCYNPEPMADFIDAFVIGDGEEAICDIVQAYKGAGGRTGGRKRLLKVLSKIEGVYVPSLYEIRYNGNGTIKGAPPIDEEIPVKIKKRIVEDLDNAFYPTKAIVPNIQIVHDRIAIEIMRGCKHICNFCQATTTYSSWRERSPETILRLARQAYAATGYDEISLLSLSSSSYSGIVDLIKRMNEEFSQKAVSVSVPSLRVQDVLTDLPALLAKVKKSGLTFAPEAGSDRLRKAMNKHIDIEKLFQAATESFKNGWRHVKLYFMIGLNGETDEDVLAIAELIYKISDLKRAIDGHPAHISGSINAFVPKPHTPLQWAGMETIENLEKKRGLLKKAVRSKAIELSFHPFRMSYIEAILSRGDRRISDAIYESWRSGSRFDGWQEAFDFGIWMRSFEKMGIDPAFYINRARQFNEILPWDIIDIGLAKSALVSRARPCAYAPLI